MSEFIEFLKRTTRVEIAGDRAIHFGDPDKEFETARATPSKCALLSLGIVSMSGADAQSFVNGQFTTDCTKITDRVSQFSGWCDPKGRVLFLFTLYTDGRNIYALLPKAQIPDFIRRLQMYVMRADVQLEDCSGSKAIFGLSGTGATNELGAVDLKQPWDSDRQSDSTVVIRHGPGEARFIIIGADVSAAERWQTMNIPAVGEGAWTALECFAGLPRLYQQTSGMFLPQELNLDQLNALSFSKGCYPGQEIIARLKYRGEVKKRLMIATCGSNVLPDPGTPIRSPDNERTIGYILYAQSYDQSRSIVSAVIENSSMDESIFVDGAQDHVLQRIDLPYGID